VHLPAGAANYVDTHTLGWILVAVGVLAIILVLVMNQQRTRTTHIERRRDDPPRGRL
jgi:hypothetical protein